MIRLSQIDPQIVADEAVDQVAQWIAAASFRLTPRFEFRESAKESSTDLAPSVQALAEYAQRGLPVWDWQTIGEPLDCLNEITTLFFGRVADYGKDDQEVSWAAERDPSTELECVVMAAFARTELERNHPIRRAHLGALASLGLEGVRALITRGELRADVEREASGPGRPPLLVSAKEARRFLAARGVPGFV